MRSSVAPAWLARSAISDASASMSELALRWLVPRQRSAGPPAPTRNVVPPLLLERLLNNNVGPLLPPEHQLRDDVAPETALRTTTSGRRGRSDAGAGRRAPNRGRHRTHSAGRRCRTWLGCCAA